VDAIEITPVRGPIHSSIRTPGSKSITNRVLLLAAMANGRSRIRGALFSDDTGHTLDALKRLGFKLSADKAAAEIAVTGAGGKIPVSDADLFVGGAGTAMRFLSGFLTLSRGRFSVDGNARMRQRPIRELVDALRQLGLSVNYRATEGSPPIAIDTSGKPFEGGQTAIRAERSSQFVSALLMPAPLWAKGLVLHVEGAVAQPFIEMTLKLMQSWGATTSRRGDVIEIPGAQQYRAMDFEVEPDASSASYFAAAAALCGGTVKIEGIHRRSVQGDVAFIALLEKMGARVSWTNDGVEIESSGSLHGIDVDMSAMPDMVATLAAIAPFADSVTKIRGVAFIRHHESDRVKALVTELKRLGVDALERPDGLEIRPSKLTAATVETYDDHRIAMSFAIAGLKAPGIRIANPNCVSKTYPEFFEDLDRVVRTA